MRYLKLRRTQSILLCFALASALFIVFPAIDIAVSALFFEAGLFHGQRWWQTAMHAAMGYFLAVSMFTIIALYVCNKVWKRHWAGVDGKRVMYLSLVLIVGAGLIVNVTFKDNFGRARPRDVAEFGGTKAFTPPFVVSNECSKNCSFSSGEGAAGFFAIALALALSRRRRVLAGALVFGTFVSFCRIAAGAHFLSDTVVSFFVMLIVADALHYFLILSEHERERVLVPIAAAPAKI